MAKKKEEKNENKKEKNENKKEKSAEDKRTAFLKKVIAASDKTFGENEIQLGDSMSMDIEAISTGSLSLDNAIGIGGLPKGRIIEISGPESSGKTMVSLSTIAECQKTGGTAAFIDAEHALSKEWAESLGVDTKTLIITQPDSGEQALKRMAFLINAGVDIVVLDSVASLVTEREIKGEMGDMHMAPTARLMSMALKKLTPIVAQSNTCCVFINQIRENVGVMYGPKEVTPGGKALKFYSSVRLRVWKTSQGKIEDKETKDQIGHNVSVNVAKNKVGNPFRKAQFDLYYNSGIDQKSEIKSLAVEKGIVQRPNNRTYTYGDKKFTSAKEFEDAIASDPDFAAELKEKVIEALKNKTVDVASDDVIEQDGKLINKKTGEILDEEIVTEFDLDLGLDETPDTDANAKK